MPLIVVGVSNLVYTYTLPSLYGASFTVPLVGLAQPLVVPVAPNVAIWAVELALLTGIVTVFATAWGPVTRRFAEGSKGAIAGALLASLNTASEYGFGSVIAALPGFIVIRDLVTKSEDQLLQVRNFGETTLQEVRERLSTIGLRLGMKLPHHSSIG